MRKTTWAAVTAVAALACLATPALAQVRTLDAVNVYAGSEQPNWQKLRSSESRVRARGGSPEEVTLETTSSQHVSVITEDELNMVNAMNTLDVMERLPGVTVTRTGSLDGTIVLRGQNSSNFRVPMFINGDRFRGRPAFQFMMISPTELERVEVIRGPASIRYGSDGLSGLVNFVTKKPKGTLGERFTLQGGQLDVTYRSNGNGLQGNVSVEAAGNNVDFRAYAMARQSQKYDTPAGEIRNSDYKTAGAGFAAGWMPNANERYELSYRYGEIRDGSSNATTTENNWGRRVPLNIHQGRLGYEGTFEDRWFSRIDASLYLNIFESLLETNTISNNGNTFRRQTNNVRGPNIFGGHLTVETPRDERGLEWAFGLDFANDHWLGGKTRIETQDVATDSWTDNGNPRTGRKFTQFNTGLFALADWELRPGWSINAGSRFDYYLSDTEVAFLESEDLRPLFEAAQDTSTTHWTGSIGTSYFVNETVELTASYGTGFRMPWHSEMFSSGWNGTTYTIPNPNLKPEESITAEVGARLHLPKAFVDFAVFDTRYRNYLGTVQSTYLGQPATQTVNLGKVHTKGLELAGKWQLTGRVNLHGNAAYVRGTNRLTGAPVSGLAPWSGLVGAQYVGGNDAWAVTGEVQFAKGQNRWDPATEYRTGGYGVVNLYAQLQLDRLGFEQLQNTQLVLGVTNLFDKEYRSASTGSTMSRPMSELNPLLSPGRSVNLTLRTRF
ncbi:TonB-dependent receptor [Corticibacter populi]|nr:TonB-dependent receptor [Corticibacter populi]RZS31910.1 hemoglobin/transferrin/lactoferrin receptor protein [Corticibacter populi]